MAEIGYGASVEIDDGASNAFAAFVDVTSLTPPAKEATDVETWHLNSANKVKTYQPGMYEPGECVVNSWYSDAEYERHYANIGEAHNFKVKFSASGTVVTFPGYIKKVEAGIGGGEENKTLVTTIKVTGDYTIS